MSFPLYLVHIPVLCSAGCLTLVSLDGHLPPLTARAIAAFVTFGVAFAVAVPLMRFNEWWVKWLNGLFDKATTRPFLGVTSPPAV
jgi:peptidoglycan/LPS O-acetylase OafA/YrhL